MPGSSKADILIATLGKLLGVNCDYVAASTVLIDYLRETSPFYFYYNPIAPAEASASLAALNIIISLQYSEEGTRLLSTLRDFSKILRSGLESLRYETLPSDHPLVTIFVRDTHKKSGCSFLPIIRNRF